MDTETVAWITISMGIAIAAVGVIVLLLAKAGFSGFPGDISIHSEGLRIYVPILASIVASILLTIIVNVIIRLR